MMERAGLMEQQVPSGGRNSAIRGGGLYSTGKEFASMRSDPFWLLVASTAFISNVYRICFFNQLQLFILLKN
jgi:hypothetical protein